MRAAINEFDLSKIVGGIDITRNSETSGKVYYNGQEYPFTDYDKLIEVAKQCVASGTYDDDTLFNAVKAAGVI